MGFWYSSQQTHHFGDMTLGSSTSFIPTNVTRLDPVFIWARVLREILPEIDLDEERFDSFIRCCRVKFGESDSALHDIEEMQQHYHQKSPMCWYTSSTFLRAMLNDALSTLDVRTMIQMGFFLRDLHHGMKPSRERRVLYHAQSLCQTKFEHMLECNGGLLAFNSCCVATTNRLVSLDCARHHAFQSDSMGVLFTMTVDPVLPTASRNDQEEVFFPLSTLFRIHGVDRLDDESRLWEVHLTLTSNDEPELRDLNQCLRWKDDNTTGWFRFCRLSLDLGQSETAARTYQALLEQAPSDVERGYICDQLGTLHVHRGSFAEAMRWYEKSKEITMRTLPADHPNVAVAYNNIGGVYESMGDYPAALVSQKEALSILECSLPEHHPDLAHSYSNIGNIYAGMHQFSNALLSFDQARRIREASLPANHPDLGSAYNNIGVMYEKLGKHAEALVSHQHALRIRMQSLSNSHPDVVHSHSSITRLLRTIDELTLP